MAASRHSLERAPGTAPIEELLAEGETTTITPENAETILAGARYRVLRDRAGAIVAVWDEGRWTPQESAAFSAALREGAGE